MGVHKTTLRRWADSGSVPYFRTPGGHRRFGAADLIAWMDAQQTATFAPQTMVLAPETMTLVQNAVGIARHEMVRRHVPEEAWWAAFDREDDRERMRETGRRLLGLAIHYMGRTTNLEPVLHEGRQIGVFYGQQCAQHEISLVDTMQGFFFFRESLLRSTRPGLARRGQYDAEEVRMHRQLRLFLDEVMYACLASYEAGCRHMLHSRSSA